PFSAFPTTPSTLPTSSDLPNPRGRVPSPPPRLPRLHLARRDQRLAYRPCEVPHECANLRTGHSDARPLAHLHSRVLGQSPRPDERAALRLGAAQRPTRRALSVPHDHEDRRVER